MNNAVKMMVTEQMHGHHTERLAESHEPSTAHGNGLPFEKFAKLLMNGEAFVNYVHKNGYHFTDALADHVTKMMENADGTKHNWTAKQVKEAMTASSMKANPHHATWGDAAYAANMAYADMYPSPITTENGCIIAAYKTACDPDGYEGMIFCRWLSDVVAKEVEIDWEAMM